LKNTEDTVVEEKITEGDREVSEESEAADEEENVEPAPRVARRQAQVVMEDESDEEELPLCLPIINGVEEHDYVDDDGGGVSQYETTAAADARERKEAKTKSKVDVPDELKYTMYDGSQDFEEKHEFEYRYRGYHKFLCHLSGHTPEKLAYDQWLDVMEYIVYCYNKRIVQERTHIKKLTLGVLCKWYIWNSYLHFIVQETTRGRLLEKI
jgi:hypothetical protein